MTRPPRADEDTETFSAASVDAALRAARAAHGAQVEIVRAMRVVAGVRGLLGQARYCVVVRPTPPTTTIVLPQEPAEVSGDPVQVALDDLLDAAEEREREARQPVEQDLGWTWTQQHEVEHLLAELGDRLGPDAARHPAPAVAEHDEPAVSEVELDGDDDDGAVSGEAGPDPLMVPDAPDLGPGWDRAELRRLGVPAAVLSRLPVEDPSDDAGWRRALVTAIASTVPAPAAPDAEHPVVVSGHGLLGAVAVMRAAVEDGATPGTLGHEGRHRPATPAAIVDVLAASARS